MLIEQYAKDAGEIGTYYAMEAQVQMMEEFVVGLHGEWDVEESIRQLSKEFLEGALGDTLMSLLSKVKGALDTTPGTSPVEFSC